MERQRYMVRLSAEERQELESIVKKGKGGAHKIRNAQILLHSDMNGEPLTVEAIARLLHCHKEALTNPAFCLLHNLPQAKIHKLLISFFTCAGFSYALPSITASICTDDSLGNSDHAVSGVDR